MGIFSMPRAGLFRLIVMVGILLILGVVMCVFDGDGTSDLCLISLALLGSALALSPLPVIERLELKRARTYPSLLADLPSPPPKF
jgi:hypothetical protein